MTGQCACFPMLRCDVFPDPVSRRGIEVSFPSKGGEMMTPTSHSLALALGPGPHGARGGGHGAGPAASPRAARRPALPTRASLHCAPCSVCRACVRISARARAAARGKLKEGPRSRNAASPDVSSLLFRFRFLFLFFVSSLLIGCSCRPDFVVSQFHGDNIAMSWWVREEGLHENHLSSSFAISRFGVYTPANTHGLELELTMT